MQIKYSFVEFHSPVFSQGKNHGTKIHAKDGIVDLWYDTDLRFMCMKYKGITTHFDTFHSADAYKEEKPTEKQKAASSFEPKPKKAKQAVELSQGE